MKIGTSNLNGNFKEKWFSLKPNENNPYRVLPPLHSLADKGQYAKYYAVHKMVVKDPTNPEAKPKYYSFACLHKVDKKTKEVVQRCPFCELYEQRLAQYEEAKKVSTYSKESLRDFFLQHVLSFQPEKRFYVNAVNTEGKVSVLPLGIKAFAALQARLKDLYDNRAVDATGIKGAFLNFKKTQKFKGDRDTVYSVDPMEETVVINGQTLTKLKEHEITKEFIEYLKTSSRDLGELVKVISFEQMEALTVVGPEEKKQLLETIFPSNANGSSRESEEEDVDLTVPLQPIMPSTVNQTVTQPVVQPPVKPIAPSSISPVTVSKLSGPVVVDVKPIVANTVITQPVTQPVQPTPNTSSQQPLSKLSDDEFLNFFGPKD